MADLSTESCVSCTSQSQPLTNNELAQNLQKLTGWQVASFADGSGRLQKLVKTFTFEDYQQAIAFTLRVADLAEAEDHHPALLTEWGKVTVTWWTHAIAGLHRNDFICAAKTDLLS
jgi:4a-hydroxytetrahydrobiopterin dehydratase